MASILGKPGGPGQFPTHDLSTVRGALQREGPRQRNISRIISLFIAATKTCPISPAISKSRDIASRASTSIAGEASGRSNSGTQSAFRRKTGAEQYPFLRERRHERA